jgi:hypothetical protein
MAKALSTDESIACRRVVGSPERVPVVVQPDAITNTAASKAMKVLLFMPRSSFEFLKGTGLRLGYGGGQLHATTRARIPAFDLLSVLMIRFALVHFKRARHSRAPGETGYRRRVAHRCVRD